MLFRKNSIKKGYKQHQKKAEQLVDNPKRLEALVKKITPKALANKNMLAEIWNDLHLLLSLTKSWYKGEYRQISKKTMIIITASFLYFLSPIDLIPDFIFGLGILDDAIVLKYVISTLDKELRQYKNWLDSSSKEKDSPI